MDKLIFMFQNAQRATERREPLKYKEVEDVMKQQLRDRRLYEYPRGGEVVT